jgi:hypothetical protein
MNKHTDWTVAEKDADRWAGDTGILVAVVEDFTVKPPVLLVMPDEEAQAYILEHDAEIQYVAEGTALRDVSAAIGGGLGMELCDPNRGHGPLQSGLT